MVSLSIVSDNSAEIKGGSVTASGDGVTRVFTIPHGMGSTTPTNVSIEDGSVDAIGARVISKDITNITITYQVPPPSGTNNLVWIWTAIKI